MKNISEKDFKSKKEGVVKCSDNCDKCDSSTKCTTCKAGYYLSKDACE